MDFLLSSKQLECLALYRYLASKGESTVIVKDIMEETGWTRYRILQNTVMLNEDLQTLMPDEDDYLLTEYANRVISIKNLQQVNDVVLIGYYLRNSLKFDILLDLLLEEVNSNNMIAERHSSSATATRLARNELNDSLKLQGIEISNDLQLIGNEKNIRILLFQILHTAYSDQRLPFPEYVHRTSDQIEQMAAEQAEIRSTVKNALRVFWGIWQIRLRHHHFINVPCNYLFKERNLLSTSATKFVAFNDQLVAILTPNGEEIRQDEVFFGLGAIYSLGIGHGTYRFGNLSPNLQQQFNDLYAIIADEYTAFFGSEQDADTMAKLQGFLFAFNLRVLFFNQSGDSHPVMHAPAKRAFPIHVEFTQRVLVRLAPLFNLPPEQALEVGFNEYFNTFILTLPIKHMLPEISVTLDFVDMPSLEEIIKKRMQRWTSVNISVANYLTDNTDLYLSNIKLSDDIPGFTWRSFPDFEDMQAVHAALVAMTVEKFHQ
ncbi:helix-turn-helix domain-containing protein [Weissella confusa]|uniref:helix-turn-helix domain-containing protein n=1 Tax=Weissella confusa TaxID=1583 RepID=UPI00223B7C82|nr:helix-turn-helix domain-containing protein [Weissella confusa]